MNNPPFTLYIVYHKILYKENVKNFSEDLLNHLCWFAVNEQIPKMYPSYTKGRLLKEWEMKGFSPMHQMLHWYQNSAIHHLYLNKDLIKTKYIGFAQYDQILYAEKFQVLSEVLKNDKANKFIGFFPYKFESCFNLWTPENWNEYFLKPYNTFYKQNHTLKELENYPLYLLHTFIIPTWFFEYMMPFVEGLYPSIIMKMGWDMRHFAGTMERVFALCIACGMLENKFHEIIQFSGIEVCNDQRTEDTFREIEGTKG